MIDDYQYQTQALSPKNEGLFGYGGKPNEGSRGFQGDIVDYGGTGGTGGTGGEQGPQGPQGPQGEPGPLIDGVQGDMLYHNGTDWTTLGAPAGSGTFVLGYVDGVLEWMQTTDCGATGP